MVGLASRSRYVVYAVEVDKLGYALTQAQPITAASPPDVVERIERYEVASFIRQTRSVSSDPQVEQQALNSLLAHAHGAADHFLDDYYHSDDAAHNPFQVAQKQTVSVQIDSILKLPGKSYEVRWTEVRRDLNGAAVGLPTHWEAELQTEIAAPRDGDAICCQNLN
jgi:type IV secretion system protein VirB5